MDMDDLITVKGLGLRLLKLTEIVPNVGLLSDMKRRSHLNEKTTA